MSFRRFMRILRRWLLMLIVLTLFICLGLYAYRLVFGYQYDDSLDDLGDTDALSVNAKPATGITNIALFGVDTRSEDAARSDCMMVLTIDADRGKIKLTSLMRDSLVQIDGHGKTKLCHAYGYGGPAAAIRAINENFDLNIEEYAEVNFITMANLIGEVGGVTVDVTEAERVETNKFVREYYESYGAKPVLIEKAGVQKLDGVQAMSYARIRKGGTGDDWGRVERQSIVLEAMFDEVKSKSTSELIAMMPRLLQYVTTSLKPTEIVSLGLGVFSHGTPDIEHTRVPLDGEWDYGGSSNEYIVYDLDKAARRINTYIYDDIAPTAQNKTGDGPAVEDDPDGEAA